MALIHRWWQTLTGRPHLPIAAYLAAVGWIGLLSGDHGTGGILPGWLAIMWTIAIAVGGTLATLGCLAVRTRVESTGLALLAYGAAVYGAVFGALYWPSPYPILVGVAVAAMCLIRMRVLSLARRAQEVAAQIRDNDGEQ